jgi:Uma2 family endonuclease
MSTSQTKLMTADELDALPTYGPGGDRRYELIRGELKVMSPAKPLHGIIRARIAAYLFGFVQEHNLGEVFGAETGFLVETDPDSVVGADAAFVGNERLAAVERFDKFFPFAPDLAVEVLSPSNTVQEIDEKVALYFAAGSRLVWVFNPKRRTVAVYSSPFDVRILGGKDALDGGDVLPGFHLDLSKLFANLKK